MPRETIDIRTFGSGLVTNGDPRDIPDDAASSSKGIDSKSNGVLRGLPGHTKRYEQLSDGAKASSFISVGDGNYDLVYYDGAVKRIPSVYNDLSAVAPEVLTENVVSDYVAFTPNNREAHVGLGPQHKPRWIGYVSHKRTWEPTPTEIVTADAELVAPVTLQQFYRVFPVTISAVDYIIGASLGGGRVYKIKTSDGTVERSRAFAGIYGICKDIDNANHCWVYVKDTTFGTLYKLDLANDFDVLIMRTLGAIDLADDAYITDIEITTNRIWLAAFKTLSTPTTEEKWLFTVDKPVGSGGALTVTNRTPQIKASGMTQGAWIGYFVVNFVPSWAAVNNPVTQLYERSLTRINNTTVAWVSLGSDFTDIVSGSGAQKFPYYHHGATADYANETEYRKFLVRPVGESATAGGKTGLISFPSGISSDIMIPGFRGAMFIPLATGTTNLDLFTNRYATVYKWLVSALPQIGGVSSLYDLSSSAGSGTVSETSAVTGFDATLLYMTALGGKVKVETLPRALSGQTSTLLYTVTSANITASDVGTDGDFPENMRFYWKLSLTYDGYQESPLTDILETKLNASGNTRNIELSVLIEKASLNWRVSHVNIYRAESSANTEQPQTSFRLVESVSLDDPRVQSVGNSASLTIVDSYNQGASYEANSGTAETLESTMANYGLAALVNNQLFVAQCGLEDVPDANHYLLRSKEFRYDMFDWPNELLRLPFIPNALAAFAGRLYVFGENQILRIEPRGMYIEDKFEGFGVKAQNVVCVNRYGIFFEHKSEIYYFDGQSFSSISEPIRNLLEATEVKQIAYSPTQLSLVVFVGTAGGDASTAYLFNIDRRRWELHPDLLRASTHAALLPKGELWSFGAFDIDELFSSTPSAWEWTSKVFTFGDESQVKKIYKINVEKSSTGTVTTQFKVDNDAAWTTLAASGLLTEAKRRAKRIQVKLSGTATADVKGFSFILRRMVGAR
jgi:hypothetical protein